MSTLSKEIEENEIEENEIEEKLKCQLCEKIFFSKIGYENHIINPSCLKEKKTYDCERCGKVFTQKSNYMDHKGRKNPCKQNDKKPEKKIEKIIKKPIIIQQPKKKYRK
jgi:uncharacterized C2H2 Zn-finger protein